MSEHETIKKEAANTKASEPSWVRIMNYLFGPGIVIAIVGGVWVLKGDIGAIRTEMATRQDITKLEENIGPLVELEFSKQLRYYGAVMHVADVKNGKVILETKDEPMTIDELVSVIKERHTKYIPLGVVVNKESFRREAQAFYERQFKNANKADELTGQLMQEYKNLEARTDLKSFLLRSSQEK